MDDLKINFYDDAREIEVHAEKGTVVCRLVGYFDDDEIVGYGVARCKGGDIFDPEKGKRIAIALAENDVYRKALSLARRARIIFREDKRYCQQAIDSLNRFIKKGEKTFKHNWEYIDRVDKGTVTRRKDKKNKQQ